MTDSLRFTARAFGPGKPPEGATVQAQLSSVLTVDGWAEAGGRMPLARLHASRQGDGQLLIAWDSSAGRCALVFDVKLGAGGTAAELLRRFPAAKEKPLDRVARAWLLGMLFVVIGLPLLLLIAFIGFRNEILDWTVALIPVEQEIQVAEKLWAMQAMQLRPIEATAANQAVEEIGARLAQAAPSPYTYRFHLVDDKAVNAYALPAGYIVVNRGLIERAASAEELAGVLAHEITHVEQRHSLRAMVQSLGFTALWTVITGDLGGGMAGEGIRQLAGLQFSRQQEVAADSGGFERLRLAGISPQGMVSFFDSLSKNGDISGGALPDALELLSSHPASGERSQRIAQMMQGLPAVAPLPYDWKAVQRSLPAKP